MTPHRSPRPAPRPPFGLALTLCASLLLGAACADRHAPASGAAAADDLTAEGSEWLTPPPGPARSLPPTTPSLDDPAMVSLRVFDADGQLVGPLSLPKLELSDAEWRERLTEEQYRILRSSGTERPFCGALLDNKVEGVYTCAGCGLPLFSSASKFKSGTGWPSFFQPIADENVARRVDRSHGMVRTEINCARCDGHLGHVFDDGPRPTGLRFCLNSESLGFTPLAAVASLADPGVVGTGDEARAEPLAAAAAGSTAAGAAAATDGGDGARAEAVFAGGCFWCVEAVFEELAGVHEAISGYAGGTAETANYQAVCSGATGHAEAVKIVYDPRVIGYADLLAVHFATHDPTTLDRQGADVGPQYRSAIFYADEQERELAAAFIADLDDSGTLRDKVVTTLEPLEEFFPAEAHHQDYVCNNPGQGYVRGVALPKVEKVRAKFADKLKERSPLER